MNAAGRKWVEVPPEFADRLRAYLVQEGGHDAGNAVGPAEVWRVRYSDVNFTLYRSGTLYSTGSRSRDPAVASAWAFVDEAVEARFRPTNRAFGIGLDETGKGELVGHMTLVGALVPMALAGEVEAIVGLAETKKRHSAQYWDGLFLELDGLRDRGLEFIIEKVPPWHVDRYNLNRLLDVTYQKILNIFLRRAQPTLARIVVDDYGVGATLDRFLRSLERQGAEVLVESGADDRFLETRVASVIARREREKVLEAINRKPDFQVNGQGVGAGSASNAQTIEWLKAWKASGQEWPWFIKRSFKTIADLDGREVARKREPPIQDELLSQDFRDEFEEGRMSIKSLRVVCPACGGVSRAAVLTFDERGRTVARCIGCKAVLPPELGFTLRSYCGFAVIDSNIVRQGFLGKDLAKSKFFEGFNLLIPAVVRAECDNKGGKAELGRLAEFSAISRIVLEEVGEFVGGLDEMTSLGRDQSVLEAALRYNAILLTADSNLRAAAQAQQVFTLSP